MEARSNSEETDRHLRGAGVVYLPWVGEHYDDGFRGHRILILGESHYDEWEGEQHFLDEGITRNCIVEANERIHGSPFWKYIEQAIFNEERVNGWAPSGGRSFWDQVAVYNFVQLPVHGGPGKRPSRLAFEQSRQPFRGVLERLRPERVLVCGKELWKYMEPISSDTESFHDLMQAYTLADGSEVWCLATVHPSSGGYSWRRLHPIITTFIADPKRVRAMLGPRSW